MQLLTNTCAMRFCCCPFSRLGNLTFQPPNGSSPVASPIQQSNSPSPIQESQIQECIAKDWETSKPLTRLLQNAENIYIYDSAAQYDILTSLTEQSNLSLRHYFTEIKTL